MNISDNLIDVLNKSIYSKTTCAVKVGDKRTKFVNYTKGVRQGCPLSPLLFNTLINDLAETLEDKSVDSFTLRNGTHADMYVDDIVSFSKTIDGLQTLPSNVKVNCDTWKNEFKLEKRPSELHSKRKQKTELTRRTPLYLGIRK